MNPLKGKAHFIEFENLSDQGKNYICSGKTKGRLLQLGSPLSRRRGERCYLGWGKNYICFPAERPVPKLIKMIKIESLGKALHSSQQQCSMLNNYD